MKPSKFTRKLRRQMRKEFFRSFKYIKSKNSFLFDLDLKETDRADKINVMMENPVGNLVSPELVNQKDIERVNKLTYALFSSSKLNSYFQEAGKVLEKDRIFYWLVNKVSKRQKANRLEALYMIHKILRNDALFTGPLEVIFQDDELRTAFEIPQDVTYEEYIDDVRLAISNANSIEELAEATFNGPIALCNFTVCVLAGLVVVWAIALVVQTVAAAAAYAAAGAVALALAVKVTTVTTDGFSNEDFSQLARTLKEEEIGSACFNLTNKPIWIVVNYEDRMKRVALHPKTNSLQIGFSEVVAIIIGGKGNQLDHLYLENGEIRKSGSFKFFSDKNAPQIIQIEEEGMINKVSSFRSKEGEPSPSSTGEHNSAASLALSDELGDYTMKNTAALFPQGFDYLGFLEESKRAGHFFQIIHLANNLKSFPKNKL